MNSAGVDRIRLRSCLAGFGILLLVPFAAAGQGPERLDSAEVVEQPIAAGQSYAAALDMRQGESADIVVVQQGIDLVVELVAPDGRLIGSVDSPNGRQGEEPLSIEAAAGGTYVIRVRPLSPDEPAGRFTLRVAQYRDRAATARLAAERRRVRREASDWLRRNSASLPMAGRLDADAALAPFDDLAREASIVGLGEATHGSREFNDLRLSLVKRLVERHRYRLIAVEGSAARWRDMAAYVDGAAAAVPSDADAIWIGRRVFGELAAWAREWNLAHPGDPVRIVGVDPQDNAAARRRLDAFLERAYGPEFAAS